MPRSSLLQLNWPALERNLFIYYESQMSVDGYPHEWGIRIERITCLWGNAKENSGKEIPHWDLAMTVCGPCRK